MTDGKAKALEKVIRDSLMYFEHQSDDIYELTEKLRTYRVADEQQFENALIDLENAVHNSYANLSNRLQKALT